MKPPSSLGVVVAALVLTPLASAGCGSGSSDGSGDAGSIDGGRTRLPAPFHPAASCEVTIDTPELLASPHVPEGTVVTYNSNPPSSGPHYPVWANFQEFSAPIDDGYLVHSLEHGAVALLYKCDGATCAPTRDALRKIRESIPTDARCEGDVRVRVLIAPAPKLDTPVAAVAWGWTYKAQCVDVPTLTQFTKDHYAQGTEDLCAAGRAF